MLEIGASGSVGGEGGNILVYPARSPIAVNYRPIRRRSTAVLGLR
jgi:hypothetical protein